MKADTSNEARFRQQVGLGDKFYMDMHEVAQTMICRMDTRLKGNVSLQVHQAACLPSRKS